MKSFEANSRRPQRTLYKLRLVFFLMKIFRLFSLHLLKSTNPLFQYKIKDVFSLLRFYQEKQKELSFSLEELFERFKS